MRWIIARRLLIALISLWVAVSLVFLIVAVAPGDFITQRLANLENQGAALSPTEIVGSVIARRTTVRAPLDATLRSIAAVVGCGYWSVLRCGTTEGQYA